MADLFISYSRQDQPLVQRLHEALLQEKREAWVDWKDIPPTTEWMHKIRASIDNSRGFVFVISPASIGSDVCRQELDYAVAQGKRLIPVVVRDVPIAQVSDAIAKLQWIFLREDDTFHQGVQSLIKAVDTDLAWVEAHTSLLVKTREWLEKKQDKSILLRGGELVEAEQWLANTTVHKDPSPTPQQMQFVVESRRAATRRQRRVLSAVVAALLVTIGLLVWALAEQRQAKKNAAEADRQAAIAQTNEAQAKKQEGIAKTNETRAKEQEGVAKGQRDLAIERENEARARQLAAEAQLLQASGPAAYEKASLLAAESLKRLPNLEADQILRHDLNALPPWVAELKFAQTVAFAVNGQWLALADTEELGRTLTLRVIDLAKRQEERHYPVHFKIQTVAISSNGRILAAAGDENEGHDLEVFDQRSDRQIHFRDACHGLTFSPGDDYLLMACRDEAVLVPTATWENPLKIKADHDIFAVAYSPGQKQVAALTNASDIYVWSLTGTQIARVRAQATGGSMQLYLCCTAQIRFSNDGKYLTAVNSVGLPTRAGGTEFTVIDTSTWTSVPQLRQEYEVTAFDFADGYDVMATGDTTGLVKVWGLSPPRLLGTLGQDSKITSIHFPRPDPHEHELRLLASTSTDHTARLWDLSNGRELARIGRDVTPLWADRVNNSFVALDSHGSVEFRETSAYESPFRITSDFGQRSTLGTCATKDVLALVGNVAGFILTAKAEPRFSFRIEAINRESPVNRPSVVFSSECRRLVIASEQSLDVRDVRTNALMHREKGYYIGSQLFLSASGRYLVLERPYSQESSEVWDMNSWTKIPLDSGCEPNNVRMSPDERYVGYDCGKRCVIKETHSWREVGHTELRSGGISLLPDDRAVTSDAQGPHVYSLPGLRPVQSSPLPAATVRWQFIVSPNGRLLAAIALGHIVLWSLPDLHKIADEGLPGASNPVFSPDAEFLTVGRTGGAKVWRTRPWRPVADLSFQGTLGPASFDDADELLAAIVTYELENHDRVYSARVWDLASGAQIAQVAMDRPSQSISISPDHRYLLADQVYFLQASQLIDQICKRVGKNLAPQEWTRETGGTKYVPTCPNRRVPTSFETEE